MLLETNIDKFCEPDVSDRSPFFKFKSDVMSHVTSL